MRPSLLHPLRDPRGSRRRRRGRPATAGGERVRNAVVESAREPVAASARGSETSRYDPDVQRVREAGGPIDRASYTCSCGYLFSAEVSTTVACPHCGSAQSW
jgi:hypothetical protein